MGTREPKLVNEVVSLVWSLKNSRRRHMQCFFFFQLINLRCRWEATETVNRWRGSESQNYSWLNSIKHVIMIWIPHIVVGAHPHIMMLLPSSFTISIIILFISIIILFWISCDGMMVKDVYHFRCNLNLSHANRVYTC